MLRKKMEMPKIIKWFMSNKLHINVNKNNIMVIFKCYFSREHIALSYKEGCEHKIRKNQQFKSSAHDAKSYLK